MICSQSMKDYKNTNEGRVNVLIILIEVKEKFKLKIKILPDSHIIDKFLDEDKDNLQTLIIFTAMFQWLPNMKRIYPQ